MAFNIVLYKNQSELNKLDKTLTDALTITGTLKTQTDLVDIKLMIENASVFDYNYLYISEFSRYYYITDIQSVRNGLWEVTAHVDVLTTYASGIRALTGIIGRQENLFNVFLSDSEVKVEADRQVTTVNFPTDVFNLQTESFILTVAGGADNE